MQDHGYFTTSDLTCKQCKIHKPLARHFICDLPVVSLRLRLFAYPFKSDGISILAEYHVLTAGDYGCYRHCAKLGAHEKHDQIVEWKWGLFPLPFFLGIVYNNLTRRNHKHVTESPHIKIQGGSNMTGTDCV
jgi:hypothetical protein